MVSKSGTWVFQLKVYCFTRLVHTSISCVVRLPDDNDNLDKLSNYKHLNDNWKTFWSTLYMYDSWRNFLRILLCTLPSHALRTRFPSGSSSVPLQWRIPEWVSLQCRQPPLLWSCKTKETATKWIEMYLKLLGLSCPMFRSTTCFCQLGPSLRINAML